MRGRARAAAASSFLACSMLLLSVFASPFATAASTTSTTSAVAPTSTTQPVASPPSSLFLSVVPPKLPADGGTYPSVVVSLQSSAGKPSIALNDTLVYLTSSLEGVGSVSAQVTIVRGAEFAVARFTTTTTPGTTSVSASSAGINATTVSVTTVKPSGIATQLRVIPLPDSELVGEVGQGTLVLESVDVTGLPARTTSDVAVTLSSSNPDVASLPSTFVTIPSGSVLATVSYDAGLSPGMSIMTASASGFDSGTGTVTVQGLPVFALKIFAQPDPIVTSATGRLVVTLVDSQGDPVPAPTGISVSISSSNTSIIATDQSATISMGQIYAIASINSEALTGTANLTASSPGLRSDFASVSVVNPSQPVKLKLIAAPNPILANDAAYRSIVVALTDGSGNPAVAASSVSVTLTSSDSAVGNVSESVSIPSGSSYAVASFASSFSAGSTFITALAQNLQSATATVNTFGTTPAKVAVQALFSNVPADGGNYSALEVTLEDASGLAAVATYDTAVQLASSSIGVASVSPTVTIHAGQSYSIVDVVTTLSAGVGNITASASGLASSSTGVQTVSPAPSQLGLYIAPADGIQSAGKGGDAVLAVQLQGAGSSPASTLQSTQVVVASSNGSVIPSPIQLYIAPGADFGWALINASEAGSSLLTASANGLAPASSTFSDAPLTVLLTLTSSPPVIAVGTTAALQFQMLVLGSPIAGETVTLTTTSGIVTSPAGVTNSAGQLADTFVAEQKGVATITASVSDPLFGNQTASTPVIITAGGAAGTGNPAKGLGVLGSILPVVLVLVIAVVIVLGVKRILKSRRSGANEDEDKGLEAP